MAHPERAHDGARAMAQAHGGGIVGRMVACLTGVVAGLLLLVGSAFGVRAMSGGDTSKSDGAAGTQLSSTRSLRSSTPSLSRASTSPGPGRSAALAVIPVPPVSAAQRAALPRSTTFATVQGLPRLPDADSKGQVVHISRDEVGFATPGGKPVTVLPSTQLGLDTWLPIIDRRPGWLQVRLPSRPNGSVSWVSAAGLRTARTDWRVRVDLGTGTMTVTKAGVQQGRWMVGHGAATTPTPVGQTFLLAGFVDPSVTFSPVIYALGTHSDTLDTFGGGPGTVAVHGWPTAAGRSGKISHGCVRVPAAALSMFGRLPTGTPVDITAA
ncbi:MAG: L,D-transpeptidase [Allobranchiibius sp.]